jgi:hypothetical protein
LQKRVRRGCELRKILLLFDRVIADVRYGVPLLVRDFAQLPLQIPKLFGDFGIVAAVLLEVLLQPCLALVLPPRVHVRVDLGVDPIRLRVVLVVLGVGEEAGVAASNLSKFLSSPPPSASPPPPSAPAAFSAFSRENLASADLEPAPSPSPPCDVESGEGESGKGFGIAWRGFRVRFFTRGDDG